jgi:hypothetical protein
MPVRAVMLWLATCLLGISCRGDGEKESSTKRAETPAASSSSTATPEAFDGAARELGRKPWKETAAGLEQRFGRSVKLPFREVFPDVVKELRVKGTPIPGYVVHTWYAAAGDQDQTCVRLTAIDGSSPSQLAVQRLRSSSPDDVLFIPYRWCLAHLPDAPK